MRKSLLVTLLAAGLTFGSLTAFSQEGSSKDYPDQQKNSAQESQTQDQQNTQPADQQDPNAQAENQGTEQEPTQAQEGSEQQGGDQYTVKKGDNLSIISEQFYGTQAGWPELARANNIENPDLIFPDQNLTIPAKSEIAALNRGGGDMEQASASGETEPMHNQQGTDMQEPTGEEQAANEQQPAEGQQAQEDTQGSDQQQASADQSEIKGEVTAVQAPDLKLKDEQGTTHSLKVDDQKMLQGIKVGDDVKVTLVKGKPTSVEKLT